MLPRETTLTVEQLIEKHTLFPLFRPFLPPERVEQVINYMIGNRGMAIFQVVGAMASSIPTQKYLRYCPACITTDLATLGEAYWHRVHQLPGITACPDHLCGLSDSSVRISPPQNKTIFYPVPAEIIDNDSGKVEFLDFPHTNVAQAVHWLLDNDTPILGLDDIRERYLALLKTKDLATFRGRVRQQELADAINGFYTPGFLNQVYSPVDSNQGDNWLSCLLRKPRKTSHPLRHILVMLFLETTPEQILCHSFKKTSPFGNGPWPCLNPVCEHYRREVIQTCSISRDKTGMPVGTFSCQCGFIYARRGPDEKPESRYKIGRIKTFGEKWCKSLLFYLTEEKCSLRETARRLNVDPGTVKHQTAIALVEKRAGDLRSRRDDRQKQIESHRNKWQLLLRLFTDKSRTELRKIAPGIYSWLYRNDHAWLFANLPPKVCKRSVSPRVDWNERDKEVCGKIIDAVQVLKAKVPLVRVSISSLGKYTGYLSLLEQHLNKLPRTKEILDTVVETVSEFQDKRIMHVIMQMKQAGISPKVWKVMRAAGLKKGNEARVEKMINREYQSSGMDNLGKSVYRN